MDRTGPKSPGGRGVGPHDSDASTTKSSRRKAGKACVYCRKRKMRCTGETPSCKNCQVYHQDCVYTGPTPRTRPTLSEIERLREENARLRTQNHRIDANDVLDVDAPRNEPAPSIRGTQSPEADTVHVQPRGSALPTSYPSRIKLTTSKSGPTSVPTYHGPTSTLFNVENDNRGNTSVFTPEQESYMRKMLFAAAAEQRHMETINVRKGNLDFDGVDPELGLHLLYLHWNRQHHAFLVTYRPAFMRDMACNGPYFSKLLLNAIYFGASKFSPRLELRKDPNDVRTAGWKFRDRVRDLLGQALDHSSITTIQALLQMSNSLFALGDEQSASWIYAGMSFRMIADLGLHVDVEKLPEQHRLSDEDVEIRRRVYWAAFVVDKMQSLYQGRPASLQADDCQVPIKFLDDYEELEHWQPFAYSNESNYAGSPSYSVSTFTQLCQLCIILADILKAIYRPLQRKSRPESVLLSELQHLEQRIRDWTEKLPEHLRLDLSAPNTITLTPPPHVLSLLIMRNVLRILLNRPFVSGGSFHSLSPSTTHSSLAACAEAASDIVRIVRVYDHSFAIRRAPYLVSYATYVAATIHVRIASTRGASSEAHRSLIACLKVLNQNSETNSAASKACKVIRNLMQSMNVRLDEDHISQSEALNDNGADAGRSYSASDSASSQAPAFSQIEPTLVSGTFAPDLDIDAIVQSFWNVDRHTGRSTAGNGLMGSDTHHHPGYANALSQYTTQEDTNGGMPFMEDLLFGFNTSELDFLYMQP